MTTYLAITQPAASWLLSHSLELGAVSADLGALAQSIPLRRCVLSAGPLRFAASSDGTVLVLWHAEFRSPSGAESWGLIQLAGKFGLLSVGEREEAGLRAAMQVFDARLQGLLLPDTLVVRSLDSDISSCVVGRGQNMKSTLAFLETLASGRRVVGVVGPRADDGGSLERAQRALVEHINTAMRGALPNLATASSDLLAQARLRPAADDVELSEIRRRLGSVDRLDAPIVQPRLRNVYNPLDLTFDGWMAPESPLGEDKRRIITSDVLERQPLRITGPAGSGKTLLLQLMAIRLARRGDSTSVLYITHNSEAKLRVANVLSSLDAEAAAHVHVSTIHELCVDRLGLEPEVVLDPDAMDTREYQLLVVSKALSEILKTNPSLDALPLLGQARLDEELFEIFSFLICQEFGNTIKPFRLSEDPRRYVESERALSALHGMLVPAERRAVMAIFSQYHWEVFERSGLLDADDIALSLLSRLRTPVWSLQRRKLGYDYVFVDEAQLYNDNEKRLFSLFTKPRGHTPVVVALDEAQGFATNSVGFAALGLAALKDESLQGVFRTTQPILQLAFHVIQQTTDLFGPDFPDFTKLSASTVANGESDLPPALFRALPKESLGDAAARHVEELRKSGFRHLAVVVMSERHLESVGKALESHGVRVTHIAQRGQRLDENRPWVALSLPRLVGGQEFDAVVVLGAEKGVVPTPIAVEGLAVALEQQALRELYIAFTRARYVVRVVNSAASSPSRLLETAVALGLLSEK